MLNKGREELNKRGKELKGRGAELKQASEELTPSVKRAKTTLVQSTGPQTKLQR
ncbi:hypothetical protein ACE1TI_02815 [Alteribacillus sp. JSM 102045]|uniref:hypothetical protein n=1 Tax=Alteribacillus sp. JSM 102045 TaxID=1562101 RepID=UPI0035BF375B